MMWKNKVTDNCVTIYDGFGITTEYIMAHILDNLREKYPQNEVFKNRSNASMIREWMGHNILFECGICVDRTKDVDFEIKQNIILGFGYWILSVIHKILR